MTQRYAEPFLCDALRLAQHLAKRVNGQISEGIGHSGDFPGEFESDDIRFLRVEGDDYFEVAFLYDEEPKKEDWKYRNKYYWRVLAGEKIKTFREKKGMPLGELSEITGLRVHALERIEDGRWDLSIVQLGSLLDALGGDFNLI